jgi:integrase
MKALTARNVQAAKVGWHKDLTPGLYLQTTEGGRSWVYRYRINNRERYMGLGPVSAVTLAEAREKATNARKLQIEGIDPLEDRRRRRNEARLEAAKEMTFGACVEAYLATHEIAWKNEKHSAQWRMTLTKYCKSISDIPVAHIDTDLVLRVLTPLWKTRTETAKRLRGRVERILSWAKGRGLRDGENPARWAGHLDEMLAAPSKVTKVRHHPALPWQEIGDFMSELRGRDSLSARALEFTILTAARTSETIGAEWSEIDLPNKLWIVPSSRMKSQRPHRVPLSDRVLAILETLPRHGKHIFPLSNMAMLELLRGMRPGLTVHGFRATFKTWATEASNYPREVIEAALAHVIGDKTEAAYSRGDLFVKRTKLMASWASFATKQPPKVIPIVRTERKVR